MSHPRKPSMLPQNCRWQTQASQPTFVCYLRYLMSTSLKLSHPSTGKEPTTITAEEGNDAIGDTPTYSDSYQETSGCSWTG
jgi:hypothetical protein